jgi:NAD(P)-dependent dehydrogenase (short-subunit alcohol dehydrogenase family)
MGSDHRSPIVLVTGAGRGIGRAIALRFARSGAAVALSARSERELDSVAREVEAAGGTACVARMDVTDLASVEAGLRRVEDFGRGVIDVLVNNAGVFDVRPFAEISPAIWHRHVAVNLNGSFHVTWLALHFLERSRRAHVFFVNSLAGRRPYPGDTAYCATKYGLRGFADALRLDLASRDIRVSSVYPGATDTSIFDHLPGTWDRSMMNRPEDVAEVVWLAWSAPLGREVDDLEVPPSTRAGAPLTG